MIWVVLGVIALAIVVFIAVLMSLAGRARILGLAIRRTRLRAEQAQKLQLKIEALQERVVGLQESLDEVTAGVDRLKNRRRTPVE